jgi:thymidylate kinase
MASPLFIVLEGIDRCGKNLQAEMLVNHFLESGEDAQSFTTPDYETATGKLASQMLLGGVGLVGESGTTAEAFALALECVLEANRYEVAAKIRRCLAAGRHAVCVRWWPSSLVYAAQDGIDTARLLDACSSLQAPDAYILLRVDPESVSSRRDTSNRYEGDGAKQARIAAAYSNLWDHNRSSSGPNDRRWLSVPGDFTPDKVHEGVWNAVRLVRGELR